MAESNKIKLTTETRKKIYRELTSIAFLFLTNQISDLEALATTLEGIVALLRGRDERLNK